jgi:transcriptional regulator with XRE-family HTH domain
MPPSEAGHVSPALRLVDPLGDRVGPPPEAYDQLGLYLRAVRDHRGWGLVELAAATRIRKSYLAAIENGDMSALPSRPFALGYVRAYAKALGLDGELALARFKQEHPERQEPLRAPIGVKHETDASRPMVTLAVGGLIAAVVVWNVVQRVIALAVPTPASTAAADRLFEAPPPPPKVNGAIALGAPTAPPAESTTPAPYVTPGLENVIAPMTAAAKAETGGLDEASSGSPFEARGAIYGASASATGVLIQARKSALLVVRRPDKQVFFARQMKAGEALRAPVGHGLMLDVTEPSAFYAYGAGGLISVLPSPQAGIDKLGADAQAMVQARAAALASSQAAQAPAQAPAQAAQPPR